MRNHKGLQTIWQFSALFALAVFIGFSINQFRNDRLALFGDRSMETRMFDPSGKRLDITLADAKKMFLQKSAVFLDARPYNAYEKGHIQGARSLPWNEVDQKFMQATQDISSDIPVITYCDGETCELSHNLALFLINVGFNNVRVLINGWTLWQTKNLPTESVSSTAQGNFLNKG